MFIPQNFPLTLLMLIICAICWGSWANPMKVTKNYRFELFYWDYALGIVAISLILALTMGSLDNGPSSFVHNSLAAAPGNIVSALIGGVIFNIANLLLVIGIDMAGLATAVPVAIGIALVVGVVLSYALQPTGNAWLLALGVLMAVAAVIMNGKAYSSLNSSGARSAVAAGDAAAGAAGDSVSAAAGGGAASAAAAAGASATTSSAATSCAAVACATFAAADPAAAGSACAGAASRKSIVVCTISGLLMGLFAPFVTHSLTSPSPLTPYSVAVFFTIGAFLCCFVANVYFMKRPLVGEPVRFSDFFKTSLRNHLLGLLGGVIWGVGTVFNFVAASCSGVAISYAIGQSAPMVAALWGVFVWKEFAGASRKSYVFLSLMFVFYVLAICAVAMAHNSA